MEQASGKDLRWFFAQWLTRSGVPALDGSWRYDAAAKQVVVELTQSQAGRPYRLPLEDRHRRAGRGTRRESSGSSSPAARDASHSPLDAEPSDVTLDPEHVGVDGAAGVHAKRDR